MNHSALRKGVLLSVMALTFLAATACGASKIEGTYSNANGMATLDLRSGGTDSFTMMGDTEACTYKVDGNKLAVACKENKIVFTIHDDGSLTGPPGSMVGALRKSKP